MRPLSELQQDGVKAAIEGQGVLLINAAELKMLKEYGMVEGSADKHVAFSAPRFGVAAKFNIVEALP